MQGGLREIVLRHDGVYVCELAGKLKRKRKTKTESPAKKLRVHEQITHTVSASAPNTVIYEGVVPVIIGNIEDVDLPVIEVEEMHAVVSDVEESIHAEVVNDSIDIIDLGDTDCEDDSGDEFVDYDYDVDADDEEDDSEVSIIEVESDEEEEVSDGDNEEDSEDEVSIIEVETDEEGEVSADDTEEDFEDEMQEAFEASGGMVDVSDDEEEEVQDYAPVEPGVEEQGRGTDDTDFLFQRLVAAVNERELPLEWLMTSIGYEVGKSVTPGIGKEWALVMMTKLTQIPAEEHAFIIMKWKIEQLAKQRKAWKK